MTNDDIRNDTTRFETASLGGISRRTVLKTSAIGAGGLAASSLANPGMAQQEEVDGDEDDPLDDAEDFRIPKLNLDTLEAALNDEILQAESSEESRPGSTTYVGEAAGRPGLFVAVSHLDEETTQPEADEQPDDVAVYMCDGEIGARTDLSLWLTGDFDETGMTFTGTVADEEIDEEATVKLALIDGEFLGVATFPGEDPVAFVASEATGDAGLYSADSEEHTDNDDPMTIRWIVLPDGRQRGSNCVGISLVSVCLGISW